MSDDNDLPRCGDENAEPLFGQPNVWCYLPRGHEGPHRFVVTWNLNSEGSERNNPA